MTSDSPFQYWAAAELLPLQVSGVQIVNVVNLVPFCQQNRCHAFYRWTEVPINTQPLHVMSDGRSFALYLHASAAASSHDVPAQILPEQVFEQAPPIHHIPHDEDDESSEDAPADDEAMSQDYSPSAHEGVADLGNMQGVTVYGLNENPMHLYVRWRTYAEVVVDLANRLRIPLDEIITYHPLAVQVVGQNAAEAAIILQGAAHLPVGSGDRLILLDLEVHQHSGHQVLPATPHVARKVCRLTPHVVRPHMLMHAGVFHYCAAQFDRCLVHVNDHLWPVQDVAVRTLQHQDYVRVTVLPPVQTNAGTLQTIDYIERQHRTDLPRGEQTFQQPAQTPAETFAMPGPPPPRHEASIRAHSVEVQRGLTNRPDGRRPLRSSVPSGRGPASDWLIPAGMIFFQNVLTYVTAGGDDAEVEWITWYLRPPLRSQSDESHVLLLDAARHQWFQRLQDLWRDWFQPHLDASVFVVAPDLPRAPYQTHVGHLLLVQGELPDQVPILLTTVFETMLGHRLSQLASFVPSFFPVPDLISTARLDRVCQGRDCYAELAGVRTSLNALGRADEGGGLCLHVPPHVSNNALLQIHAEVQHRHFGPIACHFEEDLHERRQDYFQAIPPLHQPVHVEHPLDGLEQALSALWIQFARPGPGHVELVMTLRSWFNDHDRFPICVQARDVQLTADIFTWKHSLSHAWHDHVDLTLPLEFHIVDPDPVDEPDDIAAHLILLQRPRPDARSLLISVLDNAIWNAHPRRWAIRSSIDPTGYELVALMGYRNLCPPLYDQVQCQIWCRGQEIGYDDRILVRHGLAITLTVLRPIDADSQPMLRLDSQITLQRTFAHPARERLTDDTVAHDHRPRGKDTEPVKLAPSDPIRAPTMIQIDFRRVI